ncbi:MAG: O-antigen ligase family protein [Pirellulaceae bacterium]
MTRIEYNQNVSSWSPPAFLSAGYKPELGYLCVLALPMLAAIASFKDLSFGGMNYLVPITLLTPLILFCVILVKAGLDKSRVRFWAGHQYWLLWYAVLWGSFLWAESRDSRAIKHAFELSTPYLFGLCGAMFVRTEQQLRWLTTSFLLTTPVALMCVALWKVGIVDSGEFSTGAALDARAHSMSLLPIAALAIAFFPARTLLSAAVWSCCLLISAIEGSRGVTLCMLVMPLFHPTFRGLHWKLIVALGVIAMGIIAFYLPPMQARLFPDTGSGTFADLMESKQSGMGRFEAWPIIWEQAWYKPVLGHGVGKRLQLCTHGLGSYDGCSQRVPEHWLRDGFARIVRVFDCECNADDKFVALYEDRSHSQSHGFGGNFPVVHRV